MARKQSQPIIVEGTGYAIASDEENDALFAEQRRLDAELFASQQPIYEAIAQNRREADEFWEELEWNSLHWWQKLGRSR